MPVNRRQGCLRSNPVNCTQGCLRSNPVNCTQGCLRSNPVNCTQECGRSNPVNCTQGCLRSNPNPAQHRQECALSKNSRLPVSYIFKTKHRNSSLICLARAIAITYSMFAVRRVANQL